MLLIDVSNVLHTTGVLPPEIAGIDVDGLIRLLGISRYAKRRLVLVCDGHAGRGRAATPTDRSGSGVEILFSGNARSADDVLIDRMNASHHGSSATLVTSDRELIAVAVRRGFRSLTSAAFLLQLTTDHRLSPIRAKARERNERPEFAKRVPLPAAEVGVWLKLLLRESTSGPTPAPVSRTPHHLDAEQEHALRELLAQVDDVMERFAPAAPVPASARRAERPRKPPPPAVPAPPGPTIDVDPELARLLQDFSVDLRLADLEKVMNAPGAAPPRAREETRRGKPRSQGRRR